MQSNKTCKGRGYLLEDLAGLAGCDYLSDLRCAPSFRYPIFVALSLLFAEDYSVKEWTDAVKYIVDANCNNKLSIQLVRGLLF